MAFGFVFTKNATQDIKHLDVAIKRRIVKKLQQLSEYDNLQPVAKILTGSLSEYSRIRVGDYRLIVSIEKNIVTILRVQHRKDVYKK
jgi:mRNA interferase RelE/StbE